VIEFVSSGLAVALISPTLVVAGDEVALVPVRRHAPHFEISVAVAANRRPSAVLEAFLKAVL
jgi:DNA-binding transcriptional LysR family regulator